MKLLKVDNFQNERKTCYGHHQKETDEGKQGDGVTFEKACEVNH